MFIDLCMKRRSYRKYTEEKVTDEEIKYILKCALLAPTAKNLDSRKFIVVTDKSMLSSLSEFKKSNAGFLKNASAAIVVLTDKNIAINTYSQDASIAATYIMLASEDLNLGSCWVNVRDEKNSDGKYGYFIIRELLNIPENYNVECIIGIGHKNEILRDKRELDYNEHVYYEKYTK